MKVFRSSCVATTLLATLMASSASAEKVLRVATTAADVPLATGQPSQGGEGLRFMGVKFHDGSEFNADAVVWNLDKLTKKDAPQGRIDWCEAPPPDAIPQLKAKGMQIVTRAQSVAAAPGTAHPAEASRPRGRT